MDTKKVIVFGSTGPIGTHLVQKLSTERPSWEIYAVTRSSIISPTASAEKFSNFPNVKVIQGDINVKEQALSLSVDKDIVYSCIGFSRYEAKYWAKHWPIVIDNLLAASSQQPEQKFVFCDNLYAYGAGQNISASSPLVEAGSKTKPAIRAMIRTKLQKRMNDHPESIVVVGGSDFFGPLVTNTSFLGDTFTRAIVEGKSNPIAIGSANVVHDFCYAPDFANALYVASISNSNNTGDKLGAYGNFWVCPHSIHGKTMQDIANDIASLNSPPPSKKNRALTSDRAAVVTVYPKWSVQLLSPFMGFMYEMVEMLPFWCNDYTIDDSAFCDALGVEATPYEKALLAYIDFYKSKEDMNM